MNRVVLRPKGQVTLPREVREALHIEEGDDVLFTVTENGVLLRGLKSIPADQAWFWSDEWQRGEREASEQLARGQGTVYSDGDEFLSSLR
ncbi:MAG: AbrB/MazE/SpoVT family DNA-binding domain-containing protein [Pseudonocardia sp.]